MPDTQKDFADIVNRLSCFSTPIISDVMAKLLPKKLKHQTMDSAIKPIARHFRVCGPAYTVRCYPGATFAMEQAISNAPVGSVIVCNGQGSDAGVMMGEIMSTVAQKRGIAGAIIDGAIRDVEEIIALGFPVFTRHITPRCGTADKLGDVECEIVCGSVIVRQHDFVIGDVNGVVVVPRELIETVLKGAEKLEHWENEIKKLILQGKSLEQAASICKFPTL